MEWHGYVVINIPSGLSANKRQAAWAALKQLGRQSDDKPARITQIRRSLDDSALIVELVIDKAEITRTKVVNYLANKLDVSTTAVNSALQQITVFALDGDWEASRQACLAYLAANRSDWDMEGQVS